MEQNKLEKEKRRELFETNREAYKQERRTFIRNVGKNFRRLRLQREEEMKYFEEQTLLTDNSDESEDM